MPVIFISILLRSPLGLVRFHFLGGATVITSGFLGRVDFVDDIENGSTRLSNSGSRHRENRHLDPPWGKRGFFIELERTIVSERTMNDGRIEVHELVPLSLASSASPNAKRLSSSRLYPSDGGGAHASHCAHNRTNVRVRTDTVRLHLGSHRRA
jgi:hypothetical protein